MALADSVPGVSGGTIAFILGFYDRFLILSMHCLAKTVPHEKTRCAIWQSSAQAGASA
ncbi:MAG: undecaprenyl phosphate translocase family protein [Oscillospiraceae bacterium]